MGYEAPLFEFSYPADVDMSVEGTWQFTAVKVAAAVNTQGAGIGGAAISHPAAGGPILGVLQNNPLLGEAGQIFLEGISKARLIGTVAIGNLLMVDANGKFLVATAGNRAVARALESGVTGDIATVQIHDFGIQ